MGASSTLMASKVPARRSSKAMCSATPRRLRSWQWKSADFDGNDMERKCQENAWKSDMPGHFTIQMNLRFALFQICRPFDLKLAGGVVKCGRGERKAGLGGSCFGAVASL